VRFRVANSDDAGGLLALKQRLDGDTSFMLREPDERSGDVAEIAAELEGMSAHPGSALILAETSSGLVGYVEAEGGRFRRNRATVHVVIGVLAAASGHGVGSGLLRALERWAISVGLHRLELTVMAHNRRAIELYERMGFVVEGRRHECLVVDGQLVDELYMAKLLPTSTNRRDS
jgi:RimJ/RimL family protein N-acetyltransferase